MADTEKKVNIIYARSTSLKHGMGLKEHRHSYYQIMYITEGSMEIVVDGVSHAVNAGQCLLYNSNELHGITPIPGAVVRMHEIKFFINDPFLIEHISLIRTVTPFRPEIGALITRIISLTSGRNSMGTEAVEHLLYSLLILLIQEQAGSGEQDSSFIITDGYNQITRRIIVYIEKNFHLPFSLREMAKALNYNPNYLSTTFHRNTGISVVEYLNFIRIRYSVVWFSFNTLDVKTAYEAAGFSSINHFSRTFRKLLGVSPRQYRKAFPHLFTRDDEVSIYTQPFFLSQRMPLASAFEELTHLGALALEKLEDKPSSKSKSSEAALRSLLNDLHM